MTAYYYVLTPEQDRRVREKVVARLVERSRKNFEELLDHMPGLKKVSGRERLAFYRSKDEAWLMQLATSYPDVARSVLRDRSMLLTRYCGLRQAPVGAAPIDWMGVARGWASRQQVAA